MIQPSQRRMLHIFLGGLLALVPAIAFAAVDVDLARDLVKVLGSFNDNISDKLTILSPEGKKLAYTLMVISTAWAGMQWALRHSPFNELIGELIVMLFAFGMVMWFITGTEVVHGIDDGFTQIATKIMGTVTGGGDATNAVAQATHSLLETAMKVSDMPMLTDNPDASAWQKFTNAGAEMANLILALLYQFAMAAMLVITALIYMGSFIMSQVMVGVAMIVAPILIPFYLIRPLSFLATGWFQFFVGAGLVKVAGAIMLALTTGFLQLVADRYSHLPAGQAVPFSVFSVSFLIVGIMAYMMTQVWNIGSTIASGPARMGLAMPTSMSPGRVTSQTMQKTADSGKAAPGAAMGAAGAVIGGASGARTAAMAAAASRSSAPTAAYRAARGAAHGAGAGGRAASSNWNATGQNRGSLREAAKAGGRAGRSE